jgi:hypothetical protein
MERVHVVTEPVSDYIRFELLDVYPANVDAGEDVRILERGLAGGLAVRGDFWLFDNNLAAFLAYDDAGCVERVELADASFRLVSLRGIRSEALRLAAPLARYVAEHNITNERTQAA